MVVLGGGGRVSGEWRVVMVSGVDGDISCIEGM